MRDFWKSSSNQQAHLGNGVDSGVMSITSLITTRARYVLAAGATVVALAGCSTNEPEPVAATVTSPTTVIEESSDVNTDVEQTTTTTEVAPVAGDPSDPGNDGDASDGSDASESEDDASTPIADDVITDIVADAAGGRSTFDGVVDELEDLDALVVDAWGDGGLGIHRGHAQVENVLEAFLGIDHDEMHEYMDAGFNLGAIAEELGKDPEALVETLTASYAPFVADGVDNGIITEAEAVEWTSLIRTEFSDRVYWDGVSTS